jgi:hypothetical protein
MPADPQPGWIGLVSIHGDAGWLIRLAQFLNKVNWKPWTWWELWKRAREEHAFVYTGDGRIVEAEPGGAREADLTEYADRPILWVRCPEQYQNAVAQQALTLVGTPYSAADYFALALRRLHIPAPGLRRYIQSSGHLICSALADRAAEYGGWHIFTDGRWDGDVTPEDLEPLATP